MLHFSGATEHKQAYIKSHHIMNRQPHILIIDDDHEIRDLLSRFLCEHQIRVDLAKDAQDADKQLALGHYDLIVLDLMMPGEDGLSFCRRLRSQSSIPVLMLTAMGDDTDRIVGLELGADDYLTKPFNPRELLARIRAILRRHALSRFNQPAVFDNNQKKPCFYFEGWILNPAKRELLNADKVLITLTSGEFDLLITFVERPQIILNRDQLLDMTKGRESGTFDRSIDVQLSRLRYKIETDPKRPMLLKTIRNGGYMFTAAVKTIACD